MTERLQERPLTRKGRATRERIVQAATDLIAVHGVAGVSTEQVRVAAGVSGSQLYHYFDSKQALIRAVITRQADRVGQVDGEVPIGALDSFDALQAWADAAIEHQAETGGRGECTLGTLAGEIGNDEDSRAAISTGFLRWQQLLRTGLHAMQERGELVADADLDDLAYSLLTALQGGALMSQTLRTTDPMRSALNAALAYVRSFATAT